MLTKATEIDFSHWQLAFVGQVAFVMSPLGQVALQITRTYPIDFTARSLGIAKMNKIQGALYIQ